MLKHEDWPGLEKISQLRAWERDGSMRHLAILTGNNALFLDFEMERGADGANTGYCFPDMLVDVVRLVDARPARRGARSLRRAPAAHPLRAAAGRGPRRAQVRADAPRHHRVGHAARAARGADGGGARRSRLPARAARKEGPAGESGVSSDDIGFAGSIPQTYERYLVPLIFQLYAIDIAARVAALRPDARARGRGGDGRRDARAGAHAAGRRGDRRHRPQPADARPGRRDRDRARRRVSRGRCHEAAVRRSRRSMSWSASSA